MSTKDDIRECPKCGSKGKVYVFEGYGEVFGSEVRCMKCGRTGTRDYSVSLSTAKRWAIESWNYEAVRDRKQVWTID